MRLLGVSRCAGLLDKRRKEEAASWGAAAARGCWIEGGRKLFLRELLYEKASYPF